jgi:histidinol-phosphatase
VAPGAAPADLDLLALRDLALALADEADRISLDRFGGPVPAVRKPDGTPVTEADRAIEAALRARIEAAHPDHAVLGEETGGALAPDVPTWVIDPIDATKNFMRGIPVYATLIGVVHRGRAVVGVASSPALGERWDAVEGGGARRNGVPVGVSAIDDLGDAQVLHGGLDWYRADPGLWDLLGDLADRVGRMRGFGDYWNHLLVAGGMAEVAFERDLKPWDIAALECIVTAAGGRMTAFDGGPALAGGGDVLTTNGLLHEPLRDLLRPFADAR